MTREELLQPADRVDVQVVGRLIQQQELRLSQQQFGQSGPAFLTAGEGRHRQFVIVRLKAQAAEDLAQPLLEPVSASGFEAGVDAVVLGHQVVEVGCCPSLALRVLIRWSDATAGHSL